ncbi:DUF4245 domain-containing protein [Nocardia asteroides]|uniref:DUF4245 domain-containing protein n=1 Tax=Nocardia asteroides TaxID=1824 RepID=UPI0008EBAC30|nr:DUF4245 domain-containing protein [Nocardia asteroides]UGT49519.1 DUF4245 domain-containing protein [Nocardia asteroides]SFL93235.1 Protein of unknown function [Nocardia asteroides]VEG37866.1 Uncharacterised protein [Nocardia asteroides]
MHDLRSPVAGLVTGEWILVAVAQQKHRIFNDYRDLFWSLIPLVLIAIVLAGAASQCTVATNGPTQGQVPFFDADAALKSDARSLPFAIRNPDLPQDWVSNSGSRDTIVTTGGGPVSTVGYITPQGTYMRYSQTSASEEALSRHVLGSRYPTGTQDIAGHRWVVYSEPTEESGWITDLDGVRILITGAGNEAAFATLAEAITVAAPLAK